MKGETKHRTASKALRVLLWIFVGIVAIVAIVPAVIYIPPVQSWAVDKAMDAVRSSSGMDISVGKLRLRFPLRLSVDDVTVVTASGDTMVTAAMARLRVKPLQLLRMSLDVEGIELLDGSYQLGTPDSAMWLKARIDRFVLNLTDLDLRKSSIDVGTARIDGGEVMLIMRDTVTAPTPVDTAAATAWRITAKDIALRNLTYRMAMPPTIDSLGCRVAQAHLLDAVVDMDSRRITASSLSAALSDATYLLPDSAAAPATEAVSDTVALSDTEMWTITAGHLSLTADSALYAVRGAEPQPGLDMNYLQVRGVQIEVDSFYNRGTAITVPLRRLSARERCGIQLSATGTFAIADSLMEAHEFTVNTDYSSLHLDAAMGMGDMAADTSLPLRLAAGGTLSLEDATLALPSLTPMLKGIPRVPIKIGADINGTTGSVSVNELSLAMQRFVSLKAKGALDNPFDPKRISGRIDLSANAVGLNSVKPTLLEARLAEQLNIPAIHLTGKVIYSPGVARGSLGLDSSGGKIGVDANWVQRSEGYSAQIDVLHFPVDAFMPSLGVGEVTASLWAKGQRFNPLQPGAEADVRLDVADIQYLGREYSNLTLDATLEKGNATGTITSANPDASIDMAFKATIADTGYTWTLDGKVHRLDLEAMKMSESPMCGALELASKGAADASMKRIDGILDVRGLQWQAGNIKLSAPLIHMALGTSDTTVNASIENGDLRLDAMVLCGLDSMLAHLATVPEVIDSAISNRSVDVVKLQHSIPRLSLEANAGNSNVIASALSSMGITMRRATLSAHNDSLLDLNAEVTGIKSGQTKLDTISLALSQHGKYLTYSAALNNRPGTMDAFAHVSLNGFLADDRLTALFRQANVDNRQGYMIGVGATMTDSVLRLKLMPYTPVIGYKKWDLNHDNFIEYNYVTRNVNADLSLSNDRSHLRLFTVDVAPDSAGAPAQEDIVLQLSEIHLADWLSVSPFAPPVTGDLGADMRFRWNTNEITGRGTVDVADLTYGRDRVGSFGIDLNVANSASGVLHADASLSVDSVQVMTATGHINDSTAVSPFLLDFSVIKFPLKVLNPFLPKEYASLSGVLNGTMDISGDLSAPVFNGYLDFEDTKVGVRMLGSTFSFSDEHIPVDSNVVRFDNFAITGTNGNPLRVNGTVDAHHLTDIRIDLAMKAQDMQVVNTNRARGGAQVFGRAAIDADVKVRGSLSFLNIDADLNVLQGTNVTYVMTDASSMIESQSTEDMVRFVNFSDSTAMLEADSIPPASMAMSLDANLTFSPNVTVSVFLSSDGGDRVTIQPTGTLNYTMLPFNEGRMTGRIDINSGLVKYGLVYKSLDLTLQPGGYVTFMGNVMDPRFAVKGTQTVRSRVSQGNGNSRLVDFLVTVDVGGSMQDMDLSFDISTDNDMSIQNELATLSPEQRSTKAIFLLTTGSYDLLNGGMGGGGGFNPYSLLTMGLNELASRAIKGVDISFGANQINSDENPQGTAMSYSYRVSKSLFNDRFKIIVGGNYSTDDNADENFQQNLINDISFEYMLNRSGSMWVRLFRHTGYESILEGEVTQTGVGFVYKKKLGSLGDMFKFLRRWRRKLQNRHSQPPVAPADTVGPLPAKESAREPEPIENLPL